MKLTRTPPSLGIGQAGIAAEETIGMPTAIIKVAEISVLVILSIYLGIFGPYEAVFI